MSRPMHGDPRIDIDVQALANSVEGILGSDRIWNNINFDLALQLAEIAAKLSVRATNAVRVLAQKKIGGMQGAMIKKELSDEEQEKLTELSKPGTSRKMLV